jgi:hypothetical protein
MATYDPDKPFKPSTPEDAQAEKEIMDKLEKFYNWTRKGIDSSGNQYLTPEGHPYTGYIRQGVDPLLYKPGSIASSPLAAPRFQEGNQRSQINLQPTQSNLPLYNAGMQPSGSAADTSGLKVHSTALNGTPEPSAYQTITPAMREINANVPEPSTSQTITPAMHEINANVPEPSTSQTILPSDHVINANVPEASADQSIALPNQNLNLTELHPSAHATITPHRVNNGMPKAPGIVLRPDANPRTYRPGMHAAEPMVTEQPDAHHYRENSKLGGVAGSVSNLFGRLGDSGKHIAQGHVGKQYDQRRTSILPGQGNVRLK